MRFAWHEPSELSEDFVAAWRDLCGASVTPNIYLTPGFLIPAVRHLEADGSIRLATVWDERSSTLQALAPLKAVPPSWRFPWRRVEIWRAKHTFQGGFLLRADSDPQALGVLLDHVLDGRCRAIRFDEIRSDSAACRAVRRLVRGRREGCVTHGAYERASLSRTAMPKWREAISDARHRQLARARERLGEIGPVDLRLRKGAEITERVVDDFLRLESAGWKAPSSLRADPAEERFFREVCDAGRESGALWFCELSVNDRVIASTTNFLCGGDAFAFKIGYDPEYARFSPGLLVEYGLLEAVERGELEFGHFDSGTQAGSYLEELWAGRTEMISGHLVAGWDVRLMFTVRDWIGRAAASVQRARALLGPSTSVH
jgi:CelD/BcsL family acetyltransferase involved in cellulose biosynthesis